MAKTEVRPYKFVVKYSAFYGDPFKAVYHSDSEEECQKWLDTHKGQFASGAVVVADGKDFPHEREVEEAPAPAPAPVSNV